jgi:hypothetical protein
MKIRRGLLSIFIALTGMAHGQDVERFEAPSDDMGALSRSGLESLEWGLLLETEAYHSKIGGVNESDLFLATAEFRMAAVATDWLRGHIGLLWEQYSREDDNLDEAYITLGASESIPYYLVAGRFYEPVGNFESIFISDPMTLELIEMNRTAAMVGYGNDWLDLNVGALRGGVSRGFEVDADGTTNAIDDSTINDFFASARFTPVEQLNCGAYWLSDLMTTYNYGMVGNDIAIQPGYEKTGGAGVYANVYLGRYTFDAEFASALNDYDLNGIEYTPMALHLEASAQIYDGIAVGIKYEFSKDLYSAYDRPLLEFAEKYPGQLYGAVVSYAFNEHASVAAEYLRVLELTDDERGHIFTVQLTFEI